MPQNFQGATSEIGSQRNDGKLFEIDYNYNYPFELNWKPGSDLSKKLIEATNRRARASREKMSKRYDQWRLMDQTLTAYVPTDDAEAAIKSKDSRKPVRTVIPLTYLAMQTELTYLVSAFLNRPYFRFEGAGPEDVPNVALLEKVLDVQSSFGKWGLSLHTLYRDCVAYGIGACTPVWRRKVGRQTKMARREILGFAIGPLERTTEESLIWEGHEIENIEPYNYLPDPNVAIQDVQKGEFVAWITRTNRMELLNREADPSDFVFNAKYIKHTNGLSTLTSDESAKNDRWERNAYYGSSGREGNDDILKPVDVLNMYIKIIPRDWGLGDSEMPEKWLFQVAGDQVVIAAQPLNLDHDMFPVAVAAPQYDGYGLTPVSELDIVYPQQEAADWMLATYIAAMRKSLNGAYLVDPASVNLLDMLNPAPGKLVRTRQERWGSGVEGVLQQLETPVVAPEHLQGIGVMSDIVERVTGTPPILQGAIEGADRTTATQAQGARQGAIGRLQKTAIIISMQAMNDLAYMLAGQTQQLMESETFVKVVGNWQEVLQNTYGERVSMGRIGAGPEDIIGVYDIIPHDGAIPGGEFTEAWIQLYQTIGANPELMKKYDMGRIFKHIAVGMGAKDVEGFEIKAQPVQAQGPEVLPDNEVAAQAAAGNIVPVGSF